MFKRLRSDAKSDRVDEVVENSLTTDFSMSIRFHSTISPLKTPEYKALRIYFWVDFFKDPWEGGAYFFLIGTFSGGGGETIFFGGSLLFWGLYLWEGFKLQLELSLSPLFHPWSSLASLNFSFDFYLFEFQDFRDSPLQHQNKTGELFSPTHFFCVALVSPSTIFANNQNTTTFFLSRCMKCISFCGCAGQAGVQVANEVQVHEAVTPAAEGFQTHDPRPGHRWWSSGTRVFFSRSMGLTQQPKGSILQFSSPIEFHGFVHHGFRDLSSHRP